MNQNEQRRILILFAGRFPGEKAAALFAELNATSFADAGCDVTILAPRRLGRAVAAPAPYRVVYLPVLDLSRVPFLWGIANYITVACFSVMALAWLVFTRVRFSAIISNDAAPLIAASLVQRNLMYEMHDFPDRSRGMYRLLFRRVHWIIATNEWKANELRRLFSVPESKVIVERNAVDINAFGHTSKSDARAQLGLDTAARIAVYTGHLYEWKGAGTLAEAAAHMPEVMVIFVGGTTADVAQFKARYGTASNIRIVGQVAHEQVPLWQSAADVLVLPNSAKEEISVHYTSPMKLFEYMASERPIVASDLPSIREILPEDAGYFAMPDSAESFALMIERALANDSKTPRARIIVGQYTWHKRAERILKRIV